MGQTKYNLNTLSEKEDDIIEITKRIDYIFNRLKMIKNSIDIDITRRDNIDDQFNTLTNDFQNIIESTYNSSQIINKAVIEYSNSEHQIQNLLNQLLDTSTDSHDTDMTKTDHDEVSISGISLLQNWFERLYNQLISKITHVKKFFNDNGVHINNKDYLKSVVEDDNTLESNVLDESAIGTYSKSESYRIFRKASEKEGYYYDKERIKKLQQYIREKGLNVEVTGKLDRATFQAVHMIGIDELKENGFIEEDSINNINNYFYINHNNILHIDTSGYYNKEINNNLRDETYFTNPPKPDSNAVKLDLMADIYTFTYLYKYFTKIPIADSNYMDYTYLYDNFNTELVDKIIESVGNTKFIYEMSQLKSTNDLGQFVFGKTLEKYSKRANTLAEWSTFANNPNALMPIALFDMVKNEFEDKKNLKNLKYTSAIDNDPFNMFLLKGYRNEFINEWETISKDVYDEFTDVYGKNLNNDQEYLLYKISSKIGEIIEKNKNYEHNINNLEVIFKDIEDKYHEEQFKKTWYYKNYILPREQGV
ncbi:hypothetical protein [Vallitalea guaymasensis]|uniref:Uncharacterized protein n=1 Tax=Vallitalea guaymasensis TaxID=1185412 RepID=A0A8J8SD10_9FIRM|nr:hypothetical protein [Vallitalea guaymasensis]QUH30413.1 hypothetical protein HYG85_16465 [Vallitalea guaymasensis]